MDLPLFQGSNHSNWLLSVCAFALFRLIYFFGYFFGNVIRRIQVWGHVVRTKKANINNWHFLKSLLLSIFRKWFEYDAAFFNLATYSWTVGGAPLTQLNFVFCCIYLSSNGQVVLVGCFWREFLCEYNRRKSNVLSSTSLLISIDLIEFQRYKIFIFNIHIKYILFIFDIFWKVNMSKKITHMEKIKFSMMLLCLIGNSVSSSHIN